MYFGGEFKITVYCTTGLQNLSYPNLSGGLLTLVDRRGRMFVIGVDGGVANEGDPGVSGVCGITAGGSGRSGVLGIGSATGSGFKTGGNCKSTCGAGSSTGSG